MLIKYIKVPVCIAPTPTPVITIKKPYGITPSKYFVSPPIKPEYDNTDPYIWSMFGSSRSHCPSYDNNLKIWLYHYRKDYASAHPIWKNITQLDTFN